MEVREAIENNQVVVFSKTFCPYCVQAKDLFKGLGVPYCAVEIDEEDDGPEMQDLLKKVTNFRTVPSIWINGQFVGGCDDVHALHRKSQLLPLIKE